MTSISRRVLALVIIAALALAWMPDVSYAKPAQGSAPPSLAIAPQTVQSGETVTFKGTGFGFRAPGSITIQGQVVATFTSSPHGEWQAGWTVPETFTPGTHAVEARTSAAFATASFEVTQPVPPVEHTPVPPEDDPIPPPDEEPVPPPAGAEPSVALGVFVPNAPGNVQVLDDYAALVGRMPAIVMWYEQWAGWDQGRLRMHELEAVSQRGAVPMITWEPWDPARGTNQPKYRLRTIAQGQHDQYIDSWATALAAYGKPVLLRFAHEMNGNWYPWAQGVNGNASADYVAAWRHIHNRFALAGASNVQWVWSPNVEYPGSSPLAGLFPGDAFVDWVAIDGYNWGDSMIGGSWQEFSQIFGPTYQTVTTLSSKPIMIAELSSSESGGSKADWITTAFQQQIPEHFPRIQAIVWFNENKERDWRVDSSTAALEAFRAVVSNPYYQAMLP